MQIQFKKHPLTLLVKGSFVYLFCLAFCFSCSQKSTSSSKNYPVQKAQIGPSSYCVISTDEVAENSRTDLLSIYSFGGSTFVACKTGSLTQLSFKVASNSTAQPNAMLFFENGIGDGVIEEGTQTYADYDQYISIPGEGGTAIIDLETPFPV